MCLSLSLVSRSLCYTSSHSLYLPLPLVYLYILLSVTLFPVSAFLPLPHVCVCLSLSFCISSHFPWLGFCPYPHTSPSCLPVLLFPREMKDERKALNANDAQRTRWRFPFIVCTKTRAIKTGSDVHLSLGAQRQALALHHDLGSVLRMSPVVRGVTTFRRGTRLDRGSI